MEHQPSQTRKSRLVGVLPVDAIGRENYTRNRILSEVGSPIEDRLAILALRDRGERHQDRAPRVRQAVGVRPVQEPAGGHLEEGKTECRMN